MVLEANLDLLHWILIINYYLQSCAFIIHCINCFSIDSYPKLYIRGEYKSKQLIAVNTSNISLGLMPKCACIILCQSPHPAPPWISFIQFGGGGHFVSCPGKGGADGARCLALSRVSDVLHKDTKGMIGILEPPLPSTFFFLLLLGA